MTKFKNKFTNKIHYGDIVTKTGDNFTLCQKSSLHPSKFEITTEDINCKSCLIIKNQLED